MSSPDVSQTLKKLRHITDLLMFYRNKIKTLLFIIAFIIVFTLNLPAAVLTVTTLEDTDDPVCDSQCSLREAISAAAPRDTIIFARELRGGTINLTKTLIIGKALQIDGPNNRRITLKGDNTFRIIEAKNIVQIDGLIIRDGAAPDGDGGGIYVRPGTTATLNLTNIGIINCTAQHGGAIFMVIGTLFMENSLIAGNTATGDGGGGGIDIFLTHILITNSTISGNRSTSAVYGAGGLLLTNPDSWYIRGSTIAFNSAAGTDFRTAGGLVALNGNPGPLNNTILAKNTGLNPDFYGRSGGSYNIIGISDRFQNVSGNIVGTADNPVDPQIEPLSDNGGLPTHALLSNSPAIDSGDNTLVISPGGRPLLADARGYERIVNTRVDRGSYEYNAQPVITNSTITGQVKNAPGRGVYGAMVNLRNAAGEVRTVITNPFGFYRFPNVAANAVYTIECLDKRNSFPAQKILIEEPTEYVNF